MHISDAESVATSSGLHKRRAAFTRAGCKVDAEIPAPLRRPAGILRRQSGVGLPLEVHAPAVVHHEFAAAEERGVDLRCVVHEREVAGFRHVGNGVRERVFRGLCVRVSAEGPVLRRGVPVWDFMRPVDCEESVAQGDGGAIAEANGATVYERHVVRGQGGAVGAIPDEGAGEPGNVRELVRRGECQGALAHVLDVRIEGRRRRERNPWRDKNCSGERGVDALGDALSGDEVTIAADRPGRTVQNSEFQVCRQNDIPIGIVATSGDDAGEVQRRREVQDVVGAGLVGDVRLGRAGRDATVPVGRDVPCGGIGAIARTNPC